MEARPAWLASVRDVELGVGGRAVVVVVVAGVPERPAEGVGVGVAAVGRAGRDAEAGGADSRVENSGRLLWRRLLYVQKSAGGLQTDTILSVANCRAFWCSFGVFPACYRPL